MSGWGRGDGRPNAEARRPLTHRLATHEVRRTAAAVQHFPNPQQPENMLVSCRAAMRVEVGTQHHTPTLLLHCTGVQQLQARLCQAHRPQDSPMCCSS